MKHKIIFEYYNGDKLYWTGDFWSLNPKKALDYDSSTISASSILQTSWRK